MTRFQRIRRKYSAEYHFGQYRAGRIHVGSSLREIVSACRSSIAARHRRDPAMRDARKSYYLGAIAALAEHRALMRQFKL